MNGLAVTVDPGLRRDDAQLKAVTPAQAGVHPHHERDDAPAGQPLATLAALVHRDLLLAWRRRADALGTLVFFVLVTALFPLAVGPEPAQLRAIAPGVLWVAALLSATLALPRLFAQERADGTLEHLLLAREPLPWLLLGKALAHWLTTGLPLVLLSPVLALQFDLPADATAVLAASLLLGTPTLSLVGSVGAALTLGLRNGAVLLALLVLPLQVPVLVFGAGAVLAEAGGLGARAHLLMLGGLLCFATVLAPWAAAAALRISTE